MTDPGSAEAAARRLDEPLSTAPGPANDLAAAMRRIAEMLVGREVPDEALQAAASTVRQAADRLDEVTPPGRAHRGVPDRDGPPQDYFATSPVIGFANPVAPPAEVWAVRGEEGGWELRGRVSFGYAFEGPPTCVHGGEIARLFDELLGSTNILTGHAGMTGTLTVRYRRPTPILTPLDLEARLEKVEGRKVFVTGTIRVQGEITAEADGLFIEAPPERMLRIAERHAAAADGEVLDEGFRDSVRRAGDGHPPVGADRASTGKRSGTGDPQMARSRPSQ